MRDKIQKSSKNKIGVFALFASIVLLCQCAAPERSEVVEINEKIIRKYVEGTWEMETWNFNDSLLQPPNAKGYILFHDGVVMFTVYRHSGDSTFTRFGNGVYKVTDSTWGYRYDHNNYIETLGEKNDTVLNNSYFSWNDFREFDAHLEGENLILENKERALMFIFEKDKQTYRDKGKLVRIWRRLKVK